MLSGSSGFGAGLVVQLVVVAGSPLVFGTCSNRNPKDDNTREGSASNRSFSKASGLRGGFAPCSWRVRGCSLRLRSRWP